MINESMLKEKNQQNRNFKVFESLLLAKEWHTIETSVVLRDRRNHVLNVKNKRTESLLVFWLITDHTIGIL